MEHRLPGGHRGAGPRCALVDRKMRGNFDDAFLFQHHIFGQHAIDAAAERRSVHMRARLAARPALEETAGDFVAGFDAGDAGPGFNHFAGAVRQRDEIFAHRRPIGAAYDAEVAIVERTGNDLDQHLPVKRLRRGPLDKGQRLRCRRRLWAIDRHAFVDLRYLHFNSRYRGTMLRRGRCRQRPTLSQHRTVGRQARRRDTRRGPDRAGDPAVPRALPQDIRHPDRPCRQAVPRNRRTR